MTIKLALAALAALQPLGTLGFYRPTAEVGLLSTSQTKQGPLPDVNLTSSMLAGTGNPMNSVLYTSYLNAENGHEYFAIACHCTQGPTHLYTYVSLLDITTSQYYGVNNFIEGIMPNETFNLQGGDLAFSSSSSDIVSNMQVTSTVPNAGFNLSVQAQGPGLYYAGSGIFYWGGGTNHQWASPLSRVSGTITVNNAEVNIIPDKSVTWMDRQWGTGVAYNGWNWFNVILENGMTMGIWHSKPINGTTSFDSFVTVQFPDGHQEVHQLDNDIHDANPWTSNVTNLTYYTEFELNIPTLEAVIRATVPVKGAGEMTVQGEPIPSRTLFEGFTVYSANIRGKCVKGYGLTERLFQIA